MLLQKFRGGGKMHYIIMFLIWGGQCPPCPTSSGPHELISDYKTIKYSNTCTRTLNEFSLIHSNEQLLHYKPQLEHTKHSIGHRLSTDYWQCRHAELLIGIHQRRQREFGRVLFRRWIINRQLDLSKWSLRRLVHILYI